MNKLTEWRQAKKKTIPEAAAMVPVERATWWRWEKDLRKIDVGLVAKVSKLTRIPISKLRPDIFGSGETSE